MKFIIFSDVHGNYNALERMISDTKDITDKKYIFCGDIMGYYYQQEEVIKILQNMKDIISVRGNHDQYYLNIVKGICSVNKYADLYGVSYEQDLSLQSVSYLSELPLMKKFDVSGKNVMVCHGSPVDMLEGRIYPDSDINGYADDTYDIVIFGHTHYRMLKNVGNTIYLNPGSLGQPRDGNGYSYCVADFDSMEFEFKNIDVDTDCLKNQILINETHNNVREYLLGKI